MAQVPVEVLTAGDLPSDDLVRAISAANSLQVEIRYSLLPDESNTDFRVHAYGRVRAGDMLDRMQEIRARQRGFHPFWVAFIDAYLDGEDYSNIFGSDRAGQGLAVFTIANVPDVILPRNRLAAYFLYYLAKSSFSFLAPGHKNHADTLKCVYDQKVKKLDLLQSMRSRAICDDCRRALLKHQTISPRQFSALEVLFATCGDLLNENQSELARTNLRPRAFVGSSVEGLPIAKALQESLVDELIIEVWNQGTVFGLGDTTLEALERAVLSYDFGVFVFTPDDELHTRGQAKSVARDNVVFELGLFVGKLTRRRAFVIRPSSHRLSLPSDLAGITVAEYDGGEADPGRALEPACSSIRRAVRSVLMSASGR